MVKSKQELKKLSKDELEEYGRTIGVELDKRYKADTLVDDIETAQLANQLTKIQLEDYGRTIGIELDRRLKKTTLIKELQEHMAKKGKKQGIINKAKEAVKGATSKTVLLRDASTGVFSKGPKPKGKSQTGTSGGVPFWEI